MEIKTNHELNEKRWVLYQNEVQSFHIIRINIVCEEKVFYISNPLKCEIKYECSFDKMLGFRPLYCTMSEEDLERKTFATKEELIKHL